MHEITIEKEDMKFSSAHFTIFERSIERLHGHNYQVRLRLRADRLQHGLLIDFGVLKQEARRLCAELDEHVLLAGQHPELQIRSAGDSLELQCRGKRWSLPAEDCRILPVANISCECLAAHLCGSIAARLRQPLLAAGVHTLVVEVQESPGQSGAADLDLAAG